jgi:uncharacterized membrane protein YphA (DoxX/SURF4 family)
MKDKNKNIPGRRGGLSSAAHLASVLVGATLIFSAFTKMLGPKAFVASVDGYGVLPAGKALFAATGVVGLELCIGVLLILGIYRRFAAFLGSALLLGFSALLIHAIRAGLGSCGCFGEVISIPPPVELIIDAFLLFCCLVVLFRGRDVEVGGNGFRQALAWGTFCLGAALFLAADPSVHADETLTVELSSLAVLQAADPPLELPQEGFLFFFSADCPHCWSFSGAVEAMATRLVDFEVHGVTMSGPQTLEDFRRDFSPSYPIHVVSEGQFHQITDEYPAGIWLSGGQIAKGWTGLIPSHRELSDLGGYLVSEKAVATTRVDSLETAPADSVGAAADDSSPFGGLVKSRH